MRVIPARAGATFAAALLSLAVALPASAQQPAPPPAEAPDEVELTTFTETYLDIQQITTELEAKIAAAQTEEEKAQLAQAAEEQSAAVLVERKIEKERYKAIAELLNADPELRAQFEAVRDKILEERKKGEG
jgi:hypothetical protein